MNATLGHSADRLHDISTTGVDFRGFWETSVNTEADGKSHSLKHLGPEATRHQPVSGTCSVDFDSRRLHHNLLIIEDLYPPLNPHPQYLHDRRRLQRTEEDATGQRGRSFAILASNPKLTSSETSVSWPNVRAAVQGPR